MMSERFLRRALILWAIAALAAGIVASLKGADFAANWIWGVGAAPVIAALGVSIARDLLAGRMGVDAVALISMAAALVLGANLVAVVVAVMYAGGTVLEDFAVARAERELKALVGRAPRIAHRRRDQTVEEILAEDIRQDDVVLVKAGEIVPVDGILLSPVASLDESALTGEPIPVIRSAGEGVRSGAVNAGETFEMRTTATAVESTYAGIVRLVTAAQTAKAPFIRMADRYALLLLPVTLVLAGGAWLVSGDALRGLAVLVASTPCPLILAAPVAFIAGVSRAAKQGILMKGGGPIEALARVHTVLFDKTGTLTVGGARLVAVETAPGETADEVLRLAASLEQASQHTVAAAIVSAARARGLGLEIPQSVRETLGSGVEGTIGDKTVRAGSATLVYGNRRQEEWATRVSRRASWRAALCVFVSKDDRVIGALLLADELRRETPRALQALRAAGVSRMVMVTGDRAEAAETMAAALDLDAVLSERSPSEKVEAVANEQRQHPAMMVGDGINDAPALAAAGVGVAMGARGATASSEAAEVVILVDRLDRVADAVKIARRTRSIARQSIVAGMALSGVAMVAAAFGALTPVAAAITQEGIDVLVILNALRALFSGERTSPRSLAISPEALREEHDTLDQGLNRLREITDALDDASGERAISLITEANALVQRSVVVHERRDEASVYPRLSAQLTDPSALAAMSRAHREIDHLARLLLRLSTGLRAEDADRYLVRDAQRIIESIEALVRLHNAQEEDIYEQAMPT
ncbi:heavy metal translocating P-type ATPase [Rhodomicrobium vannielii ATCC 17100]|uniref:P-type Zn(2+) transporter n=2 Tax=Rhodomicrobium vannielii TaxID=1069 RepID=E3I1H2_RHOVT|nr:heavy metal translocating P-type ATPase [Rhodomicrobium vannielii ATCC 17100]